MKRAWLIAVVVLAGCGGTVQGTDGGDAGGDAVATDAAPSADAGRCPANYVEHLCSPPPTAAYVCAPAPGARWTLTVTEFGLRDTAGMASTLRLCVTAAGREICSAEFPASAGASAVSLALSTVTSEELAEMRWVLRGAGDAGGASYCATDTDVRRGVAFDCSFQNWRELNPPPEVIVRCPESNAQWEARVSIVPAS